MTAGNKIAFFYPSYYPVSGGSSVHGYNLAKNLTELGYRLTTFTDKPDGFTTHKKKTAIAVFSAIMRSDIVYVRIGTGGISRRIPGLAKLFGKKVIAEINGPADELAVTKSMSSEEVLQADKSLAKILRRCDAVITVSELMGDYCRTVLHHPVVFVIENGGETFNLSELKIENQFKDKIDLIRRKFKKIAVWSGTHYPWQGFERIRALIESSSVENAFFLISNDRSVWSAVAGFENVFCFEKLSRDEAAYLILQADTGLAIYGDFEWSRFKQFHGSSLKFYEYLANGLCVIASPTGHMKNIKAQNICLTNDIEEMKNFLLQCNKKSGVNSFRSWRDVAVDTSNVIQSLF